MTNQELIDYLAPQGYDNLQVLEDGTLIGTTRLMYTTAIFIDLTYHGWGKRFCFTLEETALDELKKLKTGDDEPSGYIARRNG